MDGVVGSEIVEEGVVVEIIIRVIIIMGVNERRIDPSQDMGIRLIQFFESNCIDMC